MDRCCIARTVWVSAFTWSNRSALALRSSAMSISRRSACALRTALDLAAAILLFSLRDLGGSGNAEPGITIAAGIGSLMPYVGFTKGFTTAKGFTTGLTTTLHTGFTTGL